MSGRTVSVSVSMVDLSGVTFLSAAALRALLHARHRNPGLCFVEFSGPARCMLELTGTQWLLDDRRRYEQRTMGLPVEGVDEDPPAM